MFSVEFTLGRRSKSKSVSIAGQIEGPSSDRDSDANGGQIDNMQPSGLGHWSRLMARLRTVIIVPPESMRPNRS